MPEFPASRPSVDSPESPICGGGFLKSMLYVVLLGSVSWSWLRPVCQSQCAYLVPTPHSVMSLWYLEISNSGSIYITDKSARATKQGLLTIGGNC